MGIKEIRMSTIAVVEVITQYLMTFGPLLGDIKKEGFIPLSLDRLSIIFLLYLL